MIEGQLSFRSACSTSLAPAFVYHVDFASCLWLFFFTIVNEWIDWDADDLLIWIPLIIDVGESDNPIPLPNVSASVLRKVIEWCEHHKKDPEPSADDPDDARKRATDMTEWDTKCGSS